MTGTQLTTKAPAKTNFKLQIFRLQSVLQPAPETICNLTSEICNSAN
jgi:hypothetical protein